MKCIKSAWGKVTFLTLHFNVWSLEGHFSHPCYSDCFTLSVFALDYEWGGGGPGLQDFSEIFYQRSDWKNWSWGFSSPTHWTCRAQALSMPAACWPCASSMAMLAISLWDSNLIHSNANNLITRLCSCPTWNVRLTGDTTKPVFTEAQGGRRCQVERAFTAPLQSHGSTPPTICQHGPDSSTESHIISPQSDTKEYIWECARSLQIFQAWVQAFKEVKRSVWFTVSLSEMQDV